MSDNDRSRFLSSNVSWLVLMNDVHTLSLSISLSPLYYFHLSSLFSLSRSLSFCFFLSPTIDCRSIVFPFSPSSATLRHFSLLHAASFSSVISSYLICCYYKHPSVVLSSEHILFSHPLPSTLFLDFNSFICLWLNLLDFHHFDYFFFLSSFCILISVFH